MFTIALLSLFLGCSSELDNKQAAAVSEAPAPSAKPPSPPTASSSAAEGYSLAPDSRIEWLGAKVTKDHPGGFRSFNGKLAMEGSAPKSLQVDVQVSSMFSDSEKLTKHLLNADFLDAGKFATASFKSTEIGDGKITGILDMHGIQKEISFPAEIKAAAGSASLKADFTIDRRLWGINYDGRANDLIKDEVLLRLDLKFLP
jgi:polyisoprenoid-binding protein YceI